MKVKAAVFYRPQQPLAVEELDLEEPRAGEVLVRVAACGVCHSDLHFLDGLVPLPSPCVLGHEAAGVVERVGEGVTYVQPGDHVILSFAPACGRCSYCEVGRPNLCTYGGRAMAAGTMLDGTTRLSRDGQPVYHEAAVAGFATHAVVPEASVVKIREDMPLDRAALIGCGVMTGVGAAINTAKVQPGSDVAVIGCGGVGLNVIQGAALAGAARIIAVDLLDHKLELARQFGATDTVNASREEPVTAVRRLSAGGVDYAFEVIGRPETIRQAFDMARRGGMAIVVGLSPSGSHVSLPANIFLMEKTITGSAYGGARPRVDMPRLVELYMAGKLKLDELISRVYPLERINEAFEALRQGEVARSVISFL
ncbi:S-(hydroxymethyl)glutathione dehydrogenase [bacterium HR25]|jgi:S-(hydroxymethyl)glutathione dehydrogenase/alcohol dehydrogenase|nr:S-(hydroxymethyl)glutathione dehydrogenase [bacterium HR25]